VGELQAIISEMIQQEAAIAQAIGAWDALTGEIIRNLRLANAQLDTTQEIRDRNAAFIRVQVRHRQPGQGHQRRRSRSWKMPRTSARPSSAPPVRRCPRTCPPAAWPCRPAMRWPRCVAGFSFAGVGVVAGISVAQAVSRGILLATEIAFDIAEAGGQPRQRRRRAETGPARMLKSIEDLMGDEPVLRVAIFKEIEALRALSDRYRSVLAQGVRLIDERAAFNKRVAAMTQMNRYQDMAFRVHRNHALQTYNPPSTWPRKYTYLAAKAYDYETNFDVDGSLARPAPC
jgi:hypothetical protein